MKGLPEERTVLAAEYITEKGATVRETAKFLGVSKSTVHKDVSERLQKINAALYEKVEEVLQKNKRERHLRGGKATKEKYAKLNEHEK